MKRVARGLLGGRHEGRSEQFFWRGLNLEVGWDGWLEVMPGYRFDVLETDTADLSILAQIEFGFPTFRSNPPPKLPTGGVFVIPLVWLGARMF